MHDDDGHRDTVIGRRIHISIVREVRKLCFSHNIWKEVQRDGSGAEAPLWLPGAVWILGRIVLGTCAIGCT